MARKSSRAVQREQIRRWRGLKWSARRIHEALKDSAGKDAYSYQGVVYAMNSIAREAAGIEKKKTGPRPKKDVDEKIIALHSQHPNMSARAMAEELEAPRETVRRHIVQLGAVFGPAQRIPHQLTDAQKRLRVERAKKLHHLKKKNWPATVTGDESWFYLNNDISEGWTFPDEEPRKRVDRQQADKKQIFVVFFSTSGFKLTRFLPIGCTMNAECCVSLLSEMGAAFPRPMWIHMDNAAPHRAKRTQNALGEMGIDVLTHPPYSPDIAPSEFWLFGRIKQSLGQTRFRDASELEATVLGIIREISESEIKKVYSEWIRHLEACIENGGEYVHTTH